MSNKNPCYYKGAVHLIYKFLLTAFRQYSNKKEVLSLNVYFGFQPVWAVNFDISGICRVTSAGLSSSGFRRDDMGQTAFCFKISRNSPTVILAVPPMLY